ncbi:hypothetical protein LTR47_009910 [Exophiala xenobiotica]|nr:hypothetical protein LTR47_009910 [Exophiala xenobiotica]KAK5243935.1 hypothetical protein LTS06_010411 [Exophiala xenobiotica]KAK5361457.1 hypothetical protein LTS03_010410 [Exophiala xenobiotica]KAK5378759.1 hypothetical protein LTR11_004454 [Exophiala xenobiotica]
MSMACIGICYSGKEESMELATDLAELCRRASWWMEFDWLYAACSMQTRSLGIDELPSELPCDQVLWEASTAFAWSACNPWSDSPPLRHNVSGYLQMVGEESSILEQPALDPLDRRLMTLYLSITCESYQQVLELPHATNVLDHQSITKVQSVIQKVSRSIIRLHSGVDLGRTHDINQTIRSRLTMHFCHLTRLSKTMTLVVKIARIWASSGWGETPLEVDGDHGDASSGSITLRDALKIRFSQNPQTARELAWHAAQILRLHRAYPSNTPHEPLSAFFAGLYLWSFAKYYYTGHGKSELKGSSKATATRLDSKPSETKLATTINEKDGWVQCGGRAVLHYVGDLSLAAAPGKILCECAAIMRQLKIWGIAGRLIDFLIVMLRREEKYTENIQYAAD